VRIGDAIEGEAGVGEIMVVLDADRHLRSIKKNVDTVTIGSKGDLQIQGSKT
jgi:pyridoxal biosynthesis lyase PdxS